MARYIDADALVEKIQKLKVATDDMYGMGICRGIERVETAIGMQPTADVVEVKHGRWAHLGGDEWCCTNCGEVITTEGSWEKPTEKYCNECGAKMDLKGDHNG